MNYPHFNLEDKIVSNGDCNVMNLPLAKGQNGNSTKEMTQLNESQFGTNKLVQQAMRNSERNCKMSSRLKGHVLSK